MQLKGLYAITGNNFTDSDTLAQQVSRALKGGADIIQYRDKSTDTQKRNHEAALLQSLCQQYQKVFIINDDIELAARSGANGVHLGQSDDSLQKARSILGNNKLIGISCYNDFQLALNAQTGGADYIAFGSFYPSSTKPGAVKANLSLLKQAKQQLNIPVCAIGGITSENAKPLIEAGADMVAVISDIFQQNDIEQATNNIAKLFTDAG